MTKIVPSGWKVLSIGEIGDVVSGGTPSTSDKTNFDGNIAWITPADLSGYKSKYISHGRRNLSEKGYAECSAKLMPKGSVLFTSRAPIGYVAIAENDIATNQGFKSIVVKDCIVSDYLYYYLKYAIWLIEERASGTTFKEISAKAFKEIPITVPPLSEQYRIVDKIEELFSELDKGVAELQKVKTQLKIYRQAVLNEAFGHLLNNTIPLSECVKKIFDGPFGSNLKTADYVNKGVRVVRLENIKNQWFDNSKQSFITKEKYDTIQTHTAFPDDVIMATFLADETKVCLLPSEIPFAVNKADCIVIRPNEINIPKFLMYFLSSRIAYQQLNMQIHGATRPRVNTKQIKKIQIPALSTNEQNKIIQKIESRLYICDKIQQTVDESLKKTEYLRQSILKQAFEGKLV